MRRTGGVGRHDELVDLAGERAVERSRSSDMKNSGPPRKMTVPWIGRPEARPAMVCVATAVKIDAARSGLAAPSLISGCRSVFANTPQRDAIGYRVL